MTDALGALFAFFFKYRPAVFEQGDLAFGAPAPLLVLLLIGLAVGVPAVLSYLSVRGKSSRRDRIVLVALRTAAMLVLLVCLFRPKLLLSSAVAHRNYVGVLIDDSRSMRIADRGGRERADFIRDSVTAPNSKLLASLRERFQVRLFRFGATAQRLGDSTALGFNDNETRLGDALEAARRELETLPVSGLVVLTDGADNARTPITDELLSLRAKSVPVFTVGIGAARFDKDIELRRVESAHTVLKGSTLMADVLVRQRGYAGATVPLLIEDGSRIVASTQIVMPADGDIAPTRVQVRMNEAGARTLTFRVPRQRGEQVAQNNSQQTVVYVRDAREKILYVEGEPRHEMRFIRAAVEADSSLQLVALQRTAEGKFLRLGVDGPEELRAGFPSSRAELFRYRAVVLGSIEASFFTRDQLAMLADFVSVRGGGLLMLGGRRAFAEGGYAGTPVADVMPVVVEGGAVPDSLTFLADLGVSLSPAGQNHAVAQVAGDPAKAIEKWKALPWVTSVNRIRRVKPGAVTLIVGRKPALGRAGDPGETLNSYEQPVLVYQRYGRGISIALPVQDTWTWKMDAGIPLDDPTFATFWRQLLRWLTSDVPTRVAVRATPDQVNPRSPVELRADVSDSAFLRLNDADVVAHVVSPSRVSRDIPLEWAVDRDGEYRATFTPEEPGVHLVRVDVKTKNGATASDSTYVRVAELNAEFVDAEMRASLLKRIADETGGRYYTPATVGTIAADIAMSKQGVTVVNEMDLWDMPINFLLLIALVFAEWGYRKMRGLA
ncbi:MAG TPA: vWA domain-containing protein [Gemmatimonadaceae bacterium]|nr:vWA domain-containing protein [Gemmatimonadaceae bacterium]